MVIDSDMAVTPAGIAVDVQARFGHSVKGLLTEKVTNCGTDIIALTKQVLKGSRSAEFLGLAARNMVMQEGAILHSEDSLRKMAIITTHLQYHFPHSECYKRVLGPHIHPMGDLPGKDYLGIAGKLQLPGKKLFKKTIVSKYPCALVKLFYSVEQSSNLCDQLSHLLK